jgi:tetratricopeptide (TPR) repeat protein
MLRPMPTAADGTESLRLADEAMARLDVDAALAHLSAAVRAYRDADDPRQEALACVRTGDLLINALGNITASRAWYARARRLVEGLPDCLEQGWVAVAGLGCDVDDPEDLRQRAELALDRARRFGDVNLEGKALADGGLAVVQAGDVDRGMAMLDEAMALVCGPADDTDAASRSVCSFFTACYVAVDFGRAASWADLLRRRGVIAIGAPGPTFLSSHCDSVQAAMLIELGRWTDAEELLVASRERFEAALGMPSWHPDIALATLRVRQGRLNEAEALLVGKEQSLDALVPTARLHLARGDVDLARASVARALRAVRDDRLRAVELLGLSVEIELAADDLDAAGEACAELVRRTADVPVPALRARAGRARARYLVGTGRPEDAVACLLDALDEVDAASLPWLRATLLAEMARARSAAGDDAGARHDATAALAALGALDVDPDPELRSLVDELAITATTARGNVVARTGAAQDLGRAHVAVMAAARSGWVVSHEGTSAPLPTSKGLAYLAELVRRPGAERHVFDLVDAYEGVSAAGDPDRRHLGDAGELTDAASRRAYRHRIEALRTEADDALEEGRLDDAERLSLELDQLVAHLAASVGLGGRGRKASSAAERARLNVTRALRSAIVRISDVLPDAGGALDRAVRTGTFCLYEPDDGEIAWIVQSKLNAGPRG